MKGGGFCGSLGWLGCACIAGGRGFLAGADAGAVPVLVPVVRQAVRAAVDKAAFPAAHQRRMAADLPALRAKGLVPGAPSVQGRG